MIDLDKWAAVSTDDLRRAADLLEQSDFAFAKTRLAAQEIAARLRAARPTDAPALIGPARLRELEALLRRAQQHVPYLGETYQAIDKALQEQPR